jgi:hypothetical protein
MASLGQHKCSVLRQPLLQLLLLLVPVLWNAAGAAASTGQHGAVLAEPRLVLHFPI